MQWGLAVGLGLGAAVVCGAGVAAADPGGPSAGTSSESSTGSTSGSSRADKVRRPGANAGPRSTVGSPRPVATTPAPALADEVETEPPAATVRASRAQVRSSAAAAPVAPVAAVPTPEVPAPAVPAVAVSEPAIPEVTVQLPPMPVTDDRGFTVSQRAITDAATAYVAEGGDPADSPRFFFGDLATGTLETMASVPLTRDQERVEMGNLAVSGYFGGIWLRDNLGAQPTQPTEPTESAQRARTLGSAPPGGWISALGLRGFGAFVAGLTDISRVPWLSAPAAQASVPVLLSLYGYNKGYLEYLLDNPPPGVPSMRDTLTCNGFLDCNSSLVDLEIANRYDSALIDLEHPPTLRWVDMKVWTSVLEFTTGAGRFVWEIITPPGGFSPNSYSALVDLSSAYLMVSKAATLASMKSYGDRDAHLASTAMLLQAGLWMWSGAYFSGLASNAPRGTIPKIVVAAA